MAKEKSKRRSQKMEMVVSNPNAAGIDIGSTFHAVAVPPGRDKVWVHTFGTMTSDLQEIVDWLKKCQVDTVAMESR